MRILNWFTIKYLNVNRQFCIPIQTMVWIIPSGISKIRTSQASVGRWFLLYFVLRHPETLFFWNNYPVYNKTTPLGIFILHSVYHWMHLSQSEWSCRLYAKSKNQSYRSDSSGKKRYCKLFVKRRSQRFFPLKGKYFRPLHTPHPHPPLTSSEQKAKQNPNFVRDRGSL